MQNDPRTRVSAPAVGLMVTGGLGAVLGLFQMVLFAIGGVAAIAGKDAASSLPGVGILLGLSVLGVAVSAFVGYAGWQMRQMQGWTLSMAGAVVAMIPCISPCCLLGIPIGIWAILVLIDDEVKRAFAMGGFGPPPGGFGPPPGPPPGGFTPPPGPPPGGYTPPSGGFSPPPPGPPPGPAPSRPPPPPTPRPEPTSGGYEPATPPRPFPPAPPGPPPASAPRPSGPSDYSLPTSGTPLSGPGSAPSGLPTPSSLPDPMPLPPGPPPAPPSAPSSDQPPSQQRPPDDDVRRLPN